MSDKHDAVIVMARRSAADFERGDAPRFVPS
jgi:hypothetical protein